MPIFQVKSFVCRTLWEVHKNDFNNQGGFALFYFNTFSKQLRETEQGFLSESAGVNMRGKWTLIGQYLCDPMSSPRGRVVLALIAMMNYLKKVPYTDKRFILAHSFGVCGHDLNGPTALSFW